MRWCHKLSKPTSVQHSTWVHDFRHWCRGENDAMRHYVEKLKLIQERVRLIFDNRCPALISTRPCLSTWWVQNRFLFSYCSHFQLHQMQPGEHVPWCVVSCIRGIWGGGARHRARRRRPHEPWRITGVVSPTRLRISGLQLQGCKASCWKLPRAAHVFDTMVWIKTNGSTTRKTVY
jgi:hypothetical protein